MAKTRRARSPRGQVLPSHASPVAERIRGGGGACPLWKWWPLAADACVPGVGIDAAAWHGYLGPLRCDQKHRGAKPEAQPPTAGGGGVALRGEPCSTGSALGGSASGRALGGASPKLSLVVGGGRTGQQPPLPVALAPHSLPSPGQPRGQVWGASGVWSPRAPGPKGGEPRASLGGGGACTGETMGDPRLGGLGRLGAPARVRRIAPPPKHAGLGALALGGPGGPGVVPSGTAGPLQGRHAPRLRHGSSG